MSLCTSQYVQTIIPLYSQNHRVIEWFGWKRMFTDQLIPKFVLRTGNSALHGLTMLPFTALLSSTRTLRGDGITPRGAMASACSSCWQVWASDVTQLSLGYTPGQIFNGLQVFPERVQGDLSSLTAVMKGCKLRELPVYTSAVQ